MIISADFRRHLSPALSSVNCSRALSAQAANLGSGLLASSSSDPSVTVSSQIVLIGHDYGDDVNGCGGR